MSKVTKLILTILLLSICWPEARAALPLTVADTSVVEPTHSKGLYNRLEKVERKKTSLFTKMKKLLAPPEVAQSGKNGWPGLVSIACAALGIITLTVGLASASVALLLAFVPFSICALVFGIIGANKKYKNKGLAIAGIILGSIEVLYLILGILIIAAFASIF